jgi:polysaccharide export outer membrane protein
MRTFALVLSLAVPLILGAQDPPRKAPGFATRDARYKLQPNDVVDVQFRYTPEFNSNATIQPDGYITLQVAGDVHVGGLTLSDASAAIAKQAGARLKDPEVTILLKDFVKPHFVIAGEVAHPGTFELRGEVGIIQAIAMGGGFKESAQRTQVIVVRRADAEYAHVKVYDVKKLMSPGNILEDITLQPNDLIVVPRNRFTKLEPLMRISSLGMYGLTMGIP